MRKYLFLFIFMALAAISNAQDADHKIVFQMTTDNPKEHKALMNNLRNLREGWGDTVQMLVVVHSPGVALVDAKNPFAEEIQQFIKEKEVVFAVCENTLKQKNIDKASLMPNLEFVPMGVAEIVTKQEQGWSYIKANF